MIKSFTQNQTSQRGCQAIHEDNYIMVVKKIQEKNIPFDKFPYKYENHIVYRDCVDVVKMTFKPRSHIKTFHKIRCYVKGFYDKNKIFHAETGELIPMKEKTTPMRNRRSLRKIFKDLRRLIYANFEGKPCEQFITLTYAEQTSDHEKILKDFDLFMKRLTWKFKEKKFGYISIVEPHASGNFHIHLLLKDCKGILLNINPVELYEIWRHGYVTIENLKDVDNIGAYFIAYFSNLELSEEQAAEYGDDVVEKNGKKYIKGLRLDFYPDYMRIYRNSRNLLKPEEKAVDLSEFNKKYASTLQFEAEESTFFITSEQHAQQKE
jgi:hypothetical protein